MVNARYLVADRRSVGMKPAGSLVAGAAAELPFGLDAGEICGASVFSGVVAAFRSCLDAEIQTAINHSVVAWFQW